MQIKVIGQRILDKTLVKLLALVDINSDLIFMSPAEIREAKKKIKK